MEKYDKSYKVEVKQEKLLASDYSFPSIIIDYSDTLCVSRKNGQITNYEFVDCDNSSYIPKGSFERMLSKIEVTDYCVISAYRADLDKQNNIERATKIIKFLTDKDIWPYLVVGHWQNATEMGRQIAGVQRALFVGRPYDMPFEDFKRAMLNVMQIDVPQEGIILKENGAFYFYKNDYCEKIGDSAEIGHAYAHYIKKQSVPFVFVGVQTPTGWATALGYQKHKIGYVILQ